MVILIKALQLVLSLSILVVIHEFGHFLFAKLFKTRVEKFYLFFNPWFSLFKFKKGETEYGIGWVPLGGYVKISGMIDESMDKEQLNQPPQDWEFRSKPAYQRLLIMLGGVMFNVILAVLIYIGTLAVWGETYLPTSEVNKFGIVVDSLGESMGFRDGDKIVSVGGNPVEDFGKIPGQLILDQPESVRVMREGQAVDIPFNGSMVSRLIKSENTRFLGIRVPFEVAGFSDNSAAEKAGLLKGDRIISLNGQQTLYFDQFREKIEAYKDSMVAIAVLRGADTLLVNVMVASTGQIGVYTDYNKFFNFSKRDFTLFEAVPAGASKTLGQVKNYIKQLRVLFSPEVKAYESVGGFITIGKIFPSQWNWRSFWELTAFLSVMLAVLNVLPIPALDGGHVMFLLYEIIARRKPSEKFLEYAQVAGMVILFALLIFANGNDVIKLFR